jgi:hypothetical protein
MMSSQSQSQSEPVGHGAEAVELDPKQIAQIVFGQAPSDGTTAKAYRMILNDCLETEGVEYLFEILITICMEGLEILSGGDLTRYNLDLFTDHTIRSLNAWFRTMGWTVYCTGHDSTTRDLLPPHYCTIYLRPTAEALFIGRNIQSNYTFILNGRYESSETESVGEFENITARFVHKSTIWLISFDMDKSTGL